MIAVILAGGKGTRLGELTREIPKPMVKVAGIPVLEHQIRLLSRYGFKKIYILTNYLSNVIEEYFEDGKNFGVSIRYFKEPEPKGTAGSIKLIEDMLEEPFLVTYGDVMLDVDLNKFLAFFKKNGGDGVLALHSNNHPHDSDLVELNENNQIIAFHSKPHKEGEYLQNLDNACLYLLTPKVVSFIPKDVFSDFGKNIFPEILSKTVLLGYKTGEYIHDMGTHQRLMEVERDYLSGKIKRLNSENKRAAIFIDRDGVINKDVGHLHKIEDFEILPGVSNAIKKINNSEYLTILITNQPVVARNLCNLETLKLIHKKMDSLLGLEGAKFDDEYFCPHHPDKGFPEENPELKIVCECRKPSPGMVKKAAEHFNIDLAKSYFIGDSWRDIQCGKNAGTETILVKKNGDRFITKEKADYSFNNLAEAVEFILGKR